MESHGHTFNLEPLDSVRFPWLFWGCRKIARNEQLLRRRKIAYIINCTPPCGEGGVPNFHERLSRGSGAAFRYLRIPIYDTQTETLQPHFEEVWEFMETCRIREDGNVLIHCNHGVSRSVAFVCSYLIKYEGMSSDEALAFVRQRNPLANPNEAFRNQLKQLYERVMRESPSGGSERRGLPKRGWVPPSASSRKRVAACSLPNQVPQAKAMRQMGPKRPPPLVAAPLTTKTNISHTEETDKTKPSPTPSASAPQSLSDKVEKELEGLASDEAENATFDCKDASPLEPPVLPAPPTSEDTHAAAPTSEDTHVAAPASEDTHAAAPISEDTHVTEGKNKTSDYSPPTPGVTSPSNSSGEEVEWRLSSGEGEEPLGCKDTTRQVELPGIGSEGSLHYREVDSKGF